MGLVADPESTPLWCAPGRPFGRQACRHGPVHSTPVSHRCSSAGSGRAGPSHGPGMALGHQARAGPPTEESRSLRPAPARLPARSTAGGRWVLGRVPSDAAHPRGSEAATLGEAHAVPCHRPLEASGCVPMSVPAHPQRVDPGLCPRCNQVAQDQRPPGLSLNAATPLAAPRMAANPRPWAQPPVLHPVKKATTAVAAVIVIFATMPFRERLSIVVSSLPVGAVSASRRPAS